MNKTVLMSHFPLPYKGIGSWTNRFGKFLNDKDTPIDYVICPDGYLLNKSPYVQYKHPKNYFFQRFSRKFYKKLFCRECGYIKYKSYWKALKQIVGNNRDGQIKVLIIDNVNMLKAIDYYSRKEGLRDRLIIVFSMHGYAYSFEKREAEEFYRMIDHLIIMTYSAYRYQLNFVHSIPSIVHIIPNAVDSSKFFPLSFEEKIKLRKQLRLDTDKIYFLWVSQDRPKKGLHVLIKAWEQLSKKFDNIELLIIGTKNPVEGKNINWLGRIPNDELPKFYQLSDFYLFTTLCHEGFGLTLIEAVKSGAVTLASNIDPIPEVLQGGKLGRLVDFPHSPDSWVKAVEEEMELYTDTGKTNRFMINIKKDLYDFHIWTGKMKDLIELI